MTTMTNTPAPYFFGDIVIPQEDAPAPFRKQLKQSSINKRARLRVAIDRMEQKRQAQVYGRLNEVAKRMTLRRAKILERLRTVWDNASARLREIEIKIGEGIPPTPPAPSTKTPSWSKRKIAIASFFIATQALLQEAFAKTNHHFQSIKTKTHKASTTLHQTTIYVRTNKKLIAQAMWSQVKDNKLSLAAGMGSGFVTRSIILASFSGAATAMTAPLTLTGAATLMGVGAIVGAVSSISREAFSKEVFSHKEKTGHWIMNAALKGALFGAVGGIVGGALREGFSAISALLHTPVILDAVKPITSTVKDAAQGLTDASAPPVVPEAGTPSVRTLSTATELPVIAPDTQSVCSDAETFLDLRQSTTVAPPLAPTEPMLEEIAPPKPAEPIHLTAENAKVLHLPVPMGLEEIVSQDVFEKLPTTMQREAIVAFKSGHPKSIVHMCKEISYHLMKEVQDPSASRQGANIAVEGFRKAGEFGLLDTKDGSRLSRDVGIMLLNGQNGIEKDVSKGIGQLMLADQKDSMVKKFLTLAETKYPQEFAEAKNTLTPEMIEAMKIHAANPTAPLRTAATSLSAPLAPTL